MSATAISSSSSEDRLAALEAQVRALSGQIQVGEQAGQREQLSLIVFSGSLDRLIAAFVLATGAAAMGMQVTMFFTFWGTAALRRETVHVQKPLLARLFGWMLPKGVKHLPLSQMNMAGGGPKMIRYVMKKNGVASVEEMVELSKELGVELHVCTMSMELLGIQRDELIDYPGMTYCGVAKFLETAAPGKITMFV